MSKNKSAEPKINADSSQNKTNFDSFNRFFCLAKTRQLFPSDKRN